MEEIVEHELAENVRSLPSFIQDTTFFLNKLSTINQPLPNTLWINMFTYLDMRDFNYIYIYNFEIQWDIYIICVCLCGFVVSVERQELMLYGKDNVVIGFILDYLASLPPPSHGGDLKTRSNDINLTIRNLWFSSVLVCINPLSRKSWSEPFLHTSNSGRWFSPDTAVSSTNKTDSHDIADITVILLNVTLSTIKPNHNLVMFNRHGISV
jgi:hypothetical protein